MSKQLTFQDINQRRQILGEILPLYRKRQSFAGYFLQS